MPADFSARLAAREPALRARLARSRTLQALLDATRDIIDPAEVATATLELWKAWIPAPAWALVSIDLAGRIDILAERDIAPEMALAIPHVATAVATTRAGYASTRPSAGTGSSSDFDGTVVAWPLECRDRCLGAILAFDRRPSSRTPKLGAGTERALKPLLNTVASILDKTLYIRRVEALSVTDDLTRLYNSRYLNQVLRRETKRALRNNRPLSLLFIDLDGFKLINDTYGHLSGSQALVEAAAVIRGSARETDIAARFGGDEFALILPDTGSGGAVAVAERVCDRLAAHSFLADSGLAIHLTASVGVATLPDVGTTPDELVQAADSAMYHVKNRGKNGLHAAARSSDK
jgi:diguanylate cyclase (GGDEF)-like protein